MKLLKCWLSLALCALLCAPSLALAHRLSVFAWVEGDMAHVQGKFSGGKYVKGGQVTVSGPDGKELVAGKTDNKGSFSFKIPQKTDLNVKVSAGMGHQGDWTIRAEEIKPALLDAPAAKPEPALPATKAAPDDGAFAEPASSPALPDTVQAAVERALDKKLTPVVRMLAEDRQRIGATEIFGGIGYIFGLAGIAAYFASRRKNGYKKDLGQ